MLVNMDDITNKPNIPTSPVQLPPAAPETTTEATPVAPPAEVAVSTFETEQVTNVNRPDAALDSLTTDFVPALPTPPTNTEPKIVCKPASNKLAIVLIAAFIIAVIACLGGYFAGRQSTPKTKKAITASLAEAPLSIPPDATIISQCAIGRGTQYAKPKDLPFGPVYNSYQGKVIGIEFMVGKDDLTAQNKSFLDLPLINQKYDHVNIGLLSQGHSGFASPHYHVDIMMVPKSLTDQITCKT